MLNIRTASLMLSTLTFISPILAVEQQPKPYIVDLYKAVKNNQSLISYLAVNKAEITALALGKSNGETDAELYWQAAEYAEELCDANTASILKKSFATHESFSVPFYAMIWLGILGGIKLLYNKSQSIRAERLRFASEVENKFRELTTIENEIRDRNREINDLHGQQSTNERRIRAQGFVQEILNNLAIGGPQAYEAINRQFGNLHGQFGNSVLEEMELLGPNGWWNPLLLPAKRAIGFQLTESPDILLRWHINFLRKYINNRAYRILDKASQQIDGQPLAQGASIDEVKKIYRSLALRVHPDKGGNPERWNDIRDAYELILEHAQKEVQRQQDEAEQKEQKDRKFDFNPGADARRRQEIDERFANLW